MRPNFHFLNNALTIACDCGEVFHFTEKTTLGEVRDVKAGHVCKETK